jgi:hypothetical protein
VCYQTFKLLRNSSNSVSNQDVGFHSQHIKLMLHGLRKKTLLITLFMENSNIITNPSVKLNNTNNYWVRYIFFYFLANKHKLKLYSNWSLCKLVWQFFWCYRIIRVYLFWLFFIYLLWGITLNCKKYKSTNNKFIFLLLYFFVFMDESYHSKQTHSKNKYTLGILLHYST